MMLLISKIMFILTFLIIIMFFLHRLVFLSSFHFLNVIASKNLVVTKQLSSLSKQLSKTSSTSSIISSTTNGNSITSSSTEVDQKFLPSIELNARSGPSSKDVSIKVLIKTSVEPKLSIPVTVAPTISISKMTTIMSAKTIPILSTTTMIRPIVLVSSSIVTTSTPTPKTAHRILPTSTTSAPSKEIQIQNKENDFYNSLIVKKPTKDSISTFTSHEQNQMDRWYSSISGMLPTTTIQILQKSLSSSFSQQNRIIIDIGANVGAFTEKVRRFCSDCIIISFECYPDYAKYIRNRFANDDKLQVISSCLGDHKTVSKSSSGEQNKVNENNTEEEDENNYIILWRNRDASNFGWNTIIEKQADKKNLDPIKVPLISFDSFFEKSLEKKSIGHLNENSSIRLIKIDTEGAEGKILKGMKKFLSNVSPLEISKKSSNSKITAPFLMIEFGWGILKFF